MNTAPFKVLLVDDEQNIRNLLKLCINWKSLGMEVIADAASGIEALTLIEELKPDIVLTDIEMPYMDGISLSRQIMEHYIDIYVIIITAHEQFSYAQQAISIGVSDFILKPIDPDVITETLHRLADKISNKRKKLTQLEVSYQYIKGHALELRNQLFNKLLKGDASNLSLFAELEIEKSLLNNAAHHLQLALINILFDSDKYTANEQQGILQNCIAYIEETFCKGKNLYTFTDTNRHIVLLCADQDVYLPELSEHITAYFKANLNTPVYCGIGQESASLGDIHTSYTDARNALKLCYILDEEVIYNPTLENTQPPLITSDDHPLDHLFLLIKSGPTQQASEAVCRLLHASLQEGIKDLNSVKYYAINLLSKLTSLLLQSGVPASSLNFGDLSYSQLINMEVYADIEKYVVNIVSELCSLMNTINGSKQSDTVSQIIHYLEINYASEDLCLASLAKQFYINPSYLSRIFKKVTNKSFTDYLVELRVQKAIQMLQLSSYKAYQIAQMIGIPDPNYFIKCFKKVTGISFQEFKAQIHS